MSNKEEKIEEVLSRSISTIYPNKESLKEETPVISVEKSPEAAGGRFEKMESIV